MASERDIKRRIGSVINTQKITKAMKLVSAAKFARASHAVTAARPYSTALNEMVLQLVEKCKGEIESPLLKVGEEKKALLVVLSTDRGLCGGLNSNLFRYTRAWLNERKGKSKFEVIAWGRKAASWGRKQSEGLTGEREKLIEKPDYQMAKTLAAELVSYFTDGKYDAIYLAFNEFQSAMSQTPKVVRFLPVMVEEEAGETKQVQGGDFFIEPSLGEMIDKLLTQKLTSILFQAFLEGAASEHGSRMSAMDSATNNANEVRKKLTLAYNRARQASITSELIEIISGAEAL